MPVQETNSHPAPPVAAPSEPPKTSEIITPSVLNSIANGSKPNQSLKILSHDSKLATKAGDNYLSIIYSVDIQLENGNSINSMVKCIPRGGMQQKMVNEMEVFEKEAQIYQNVLPSLKSFQLEDRKLPSSLLCSPWPDYYASHVDGSTDFLALENLRVSGFKMGDRAAGFDFNHCALVLQTLARYHATSFAKFGGSRDRILELYPLLSAKRKEGQKLDMTQQFISQSFMSQRDSFLKLGDQLAASRLEKLAQMDVMSWVEELCEKPEFSNKSVITHGDCWVNNILLRYEGEIPVEVKFVDFQITGAASRCFDIFYFLMTSAKLEMLDEKEEELLMIYFAEFTRFAEILGLDTKKKGLTWKDFQEEGDSCRFFGVCFGLMVAPLLAADTGNEETSSSLEAFKNDNGGNGGDKKGNGEDSMKKFYEGIGSTNKGLVKARKILTEYLPRCKDVENYL